MRQKKPQKPPPAPPDAGAVASSTGGDESAVATLRALQQLAMSQKLANRPLRLLLFGEEHGAHAAGTDAIEDAERVDPCRKVGIEVELLAHFRGDGGTNAASEA